MSRQRKRAIARSAAKRTRKDARPTAKDQRDIQKIMWDRDDDGDIETGATKRRGRGLSGESKDLIARAYAVLEREHPSGVRRVGYALFGNQVNHWVKKLSGLLVRARKDGTIPWEWISDDTRPDREPYVVDDMGEMSATNRTCPSYDPWTQQPVRVLVWSEKSLGDTLAPVLERYLVPFCVHHGNTSWSKLRRTLQRLGARHRLVILYCGDHDPKGVRISEDDLPKRLAELAKLFGINRDRISIRRIALLRADVMKLQDFKDAFKPGDQDIPWYRAKTGLNYGVELEAIPSTELRDRVEEAIQEEIVDVAAWNRVMNASQVVRESWQAYVDQWPVPSIQGLGSEYSEDKP